MDNNSTLKAQLKEYIRNKILDGTYKVGDKLPSERAISAELGINRSTVRESITEIIREGWLRSVPRKGTYVVNQKITWNLFSLQGFTMRIKNKNLDAKVVIVNKEVVPCYEHLSRKLNVDKDSPIFCLTRLIFANDIPIQVDDIYIPVKYAPNILDYDLNVYSLTTIYDLYNITIVEARQTLTLVKLAEPISKLLEVEVGLPAFMFNCTSYDENSRPVEYCHSYARGDMCIYRTRLRS